MMEQYINSEEKRSKLLLQIKNCIENKPYPNPVSDYYFYNKDDITKLTKILDNYIKDMIILENANTTMCNTICQISELHDKCGGEFIDEYRQQKLEEFLLLVADSVKFYSAFAVLELQKRWW